MHLTYPDSDGHKAPASPANAGGDGAPEVEIEVTPEMIEAGLIPFLRFHRESMDDEAAVRQVYLAMEAISRGANSKPL
jgi:hypothetical protein